ncbi:TPA: hypothetical protein ACXJEZ_001796 [Providencia rettgeri]|uniref:Uncharacterized protein n=1 Tax=Providencia stuartii TaxID=588 RepID=A0AAI9DCF5_PROST|nr:hypothetical protein [Providencia stuartii]
MTIIGSGEKKGIDGTLQVGVTNILKMSQLARYTMTTTGGTVITGVIPANGQIEVKNGGDIASFDVYVDNVDTTLKPVE